MIKTVVMYQYICVKNWIHVITADHYASIEDARAAIKKAGNEHKVVEAYIPSRLMAETEVPDEFEYQWICRNKDERFKLTDCHYKTEKDAQDSFNDDAPWTVINKYYPSMREANEA